MSWSMGFEAPSHDDLRTHATAFAAQLKDPAQAAQVVEVAELAVTVAEKLGATHYRAELAGHVGGKDGVGDSMVIIVNRMADLPVAEKKS